MPLLELWKVSPDAINKLSIEQVIAMAGEGRLKDDSSCSDELRLFLLEVDSLQIRKFISECLDESFQGSGFILQDLVNELGRRLDYNVNNGRYKGKRREIGYDGIWESTDSKDLVIEVKTTDVYRINLDKISEYRSDLIKAGRIKDNSSILLIVGRQDTGELEAQIRGSRHAWDVRLISIDSLTRLVSLKENTDDDETGRKIRELLTPIEYTKLDHLIDIVFTAARDAEEYSHTIDKVFSEKESIKPEKQIERTSGDIIESVRSRCIAALSQKFGINLIKKSRTSYWDAEHAFRIACTVSKHYTGGDCDYWYAFHKRWLDFLGQGKNSYYVLGCVDGDEAYVLPYDFINKHLDEIHTTINKDLNRHYWHIKLKRSSAGEFLLHLPKKKNWISLQSFRLRI